MSLERAAAAVESQPLLPAEAVPRPPACRLRCRLVCKAWAVVPPRELDASSMAYHDTQERQHTAASALAACGSLALFLGRPSMCSCLEKLNLSHMPKELPSAALAALIMQVPRCAPSLRRLTLEQHGMDAATLRCCARALAQLPRLTDLKLLFHGSMPITPFSQISSLRYLYIDCEGSADFLPTAPLPHLRAITVENDAQVAWDKLPSLEYICCDLRTPLDLSACAPNLRCLCSMDAPVISPLPRLHTLTCVLAKLPSFSTSLPALRQLALDCRTPAEFQFPLPRAVRRALQGLPALKQLHIFPSGGHSLEARPLADLDAVARLQRLLPHVTLSFAHCSFGEWWYQEFDMTPVGFPLS